MDLVWLAIGIAGLLVGGDMLVRHAVTLARLAGLSPMVIGLTLVGFGTSTPELVTSVTAALDGAPGIAVGNVVGSNIANILLILGLSALVLPFAVNAAAFRRDGTALVLASLLGAGLMMTGAVTWWGGSILVVALAGYLSYTLWSERRAPSEAQAVYEGEADLMRPAGRGAWRAGLLFVVALVIVMGAARALVSGAVGIAEAWGVSETVIGLTIVAVGTSMPELVTSVVAARRGHGDVALGNVIGSNIFNVLGILGITALVTAVPVPGQILRFDLGVMLAATLALVVVARTGWRVGRIEGGVLVSAFVVYTGFLVAQA